MENRINQERNVTDALTQEQLGVFVAAKELSRENKLSKRDIDDIRDSMPRSLDALTELFWLYVSAKSFDRVEQISTEILKIHPGAFSVRLCLIKMLLDRGKSVIIGANALEIARSHLQEAEAQSGLAGKDWAEIATCYMRLKQCQAAVEPARRALEMAGEKNKLSVRLRLIEVMAAAGLREDARKMLKKDLPDLDRYEHVLHAAIISETLNDHKEAVALGRRAASCLPPPKEAPDSYFTTARLMLRRGEASEGRALIRRVGFLADVDPARLKKYHQLCFDLQLNGLALGYARAALVHYPDDVTLFQRVGLLKMLPSDPYAN